MGYCINIPACSRQNCQHAACDHDANDPIHPCRNTQCLQDPTGCQAFVFPEGMNESDFIGGGGSSGGGGATGGW